MKTISKQEQFAPIVAALAPEAERLNLQVRCTSPAIAYAGIWFGNENVSVNVPVSVTDVEVIRSFMQEVTLAHREGVAKGKRETQMAVMASMGMTVDEEGFVKFGS